MAMYVDDMRLPARVGRIDAKWSHLLADTDEELHAFAASIGTESKRSQAIRAGAIEIAYGGPESIALTRRKRALKPPAPQLALPLNEGS